MSLYLEIRIYTRKFSKNNQLNRSLLWSEVVSPLWQFLLQISHRICQTIWMQSGCAHLKTASLSHLLHFWLFSIVFSGEEFGIPTFLGETNSCLDFFLGLTIFTMILYWPCNLSHLLRVNDKSSRNFNSSPLLLAEAEVLAWDLTNVLRYSSK